MCDAMNNTIEDPIDSAIPLGLGSRVETISAGDQCGRSGQYSAMIVTLSAVRDRLQEKKASSPTMETANPSELSWMAGSVPPGSTQESVSENPRPSGALGDGGRHRR